MNCLIVAAGQGARLREKLELKPLIPLRGMPLIRHVMDRARQAGIVQSLITTCRLHGVDPYTYLVDVLQRVGQHPAARVAELTPRLWKQQFAQAPLRSDLQHRGA